MMDRASPAAHVFAADAVLAPAAAAQEDAAVVVVVVPQLHFCALPIRPVVLFAGADAAAVPIEPAPRARIAAFVVGFAVPAPET
jgi:hypothetical protein